VSTLRQHFSEAATWYKAHDEAAFGTRQLASEPFRGRGFGYQSFNGTGQAAPIVRLGTDPFGLYFDDEACRRGSHSEALRKGVREALRSGSDVSTGKLKHHDEFRSVSVHAFCKK
jgi:hypothetical protein